MITRTDEATGEIAVLSYDTTQLQDFGDFVSAGLEELSKRDTSTWALGDIAAAFEIRLGRPEKKRGKTDEEQDPTPTLTNLATQWGVSKMTVSDWRSNSIFYEVNVRHVLHSWRDGNVIRKYVEWELAGEDDIEAKIERGMEIVEEAEALARYGTALEMWLKEKRRAVQNSYPIPPGQYQVIYADPPWEYGNTMPEEKRMGQEFHYQTMTVPEIAAMPMKGIAADNAVLFLWVTSPILEESFEVVKAWGFEYKSSFVWHKEGASALAHYNDMIHEILLVCVRGSFMPVEPMRFKSVVSIPRTRKHSEKPAYFRELIEQLYPDTARVELFSRQAVEGWTAYGNQVAEAT